MCLPSSEPRVNDMTFSGLLRFPKKGWMSLIPDISLISLLIEIKTPFSDNSLTRRQQSRYARTQENMWTWIFSSVQWKIGRTIKCLVSFICLKDASIPYANIRIKDIEPNRCAVVWFKTCHAFRYAETICSLVKSVRFVKRAVFPRYLLRISSSCSSECL